MSITDRRLLLARFWLRVGYFPWPGGQTLGLCVYSCPDTTVTGLASKGTKLVGVSSGHEATIIGLQLEKGGGEGAWAERRMGRGVKKRDAAPS